MVVSTLLCQELNDYSKVSGKNGCIYVYMYAIKTNNLKGFNFFGPFQNYIFVYLYNYSGYCSVYTCTKVKRINIWLVVNH